MFFSFVSSVGRERKTRECCVYRRHTDHCLAPSQRLKSHSNGKKVRNKKRDKTREEGWAREQGWGTRVRACVSWLDCSCTFQALTYAPPAVCTWITMARTRPTTTGGSGWWWGGGTKATQQQQQNAPPILFCYHKKSFFSSNRWRTLTNIWVFLVRNCVFVVIWEIKPSYSLYLAPTYFLIRSFFISERHKIFTFQVLITYSSTY